MLLVGGGAIYYLPRLRFFDFAAAYIPPLQRAMLGAMAIVLVLMISKAIKMNLINPLTGTVARFNFRVSNYTWIEPIVRYLVEPKNAGRVKTRLIKKCSNN